MQTASPIPGDLLVFISYRREDSSGYAGWLNSALAKRFRPDQLYMDVDAIPPGVDFSEHIQQAVGRCDALLAVIGPRWLTVADETGRRRLDDPNDFVRLEIEAALQRDVRVIPVLVQGARMPQSEQLPESLRPLARRNALEISDVRFKFDAEKLSGVLAGIQRAKSAGPTPVPMPQHQPLTKVRKRPILGVAVALAVGAALLMVVLAKVVGPPATSPTPATAGTALSSAPASPSAAPSPSATSASLPSASASLSPSPAESISLTFTSQELDLLDRLPLIATQATDASPICGRNLLEDGRPLTARGLAASVRCIPTEGPLSTT